MVFEQKDHMLLHVQYEGQECSQNIFYTGAAQQIEPSVDWLLQNKEEFFLVGSDFSSQPLIPSLSTTCVSKAVKQSVRITPLGNTEVTPIITKLSRFCPMAV